MLRLSPQVLDRMNSSNSSRPYLTYKPYSTPIEQQTSTELEVDDSQPGAGTVDGDAVGDGSD